MLLEAEELRREHPGCGVEKMYYTLQPDFIGRDRFIAAFMSLGFRLKKSKNYRRTTFAGRINYPNLIQGKQVDSPSIIWQSDITYIRVSERFYYAVFIIDVYTKQIVGWQLSDHMRATANRKALRMALKAHKAPVIHHSDKGSQYTSKEYISLLTQHQCTISMGDTAMDNAYAERINKTIKEEYLDFYKIENFKQLCSKAKKAIKHYNQKRIHNAIGRKTPNQFQIDWSKLSKKNRPILSIFEYISQ